MKISLLSSESDMSIEIRGKIDADRLIQFSDILDHAMLKKTNVGYFQNEGRLVLKLERNQYEKKKKKFLWFNLWISGKYPTKKCMVSICDIETCNIRDEDPEKIDLLIGGVSISGNDIYIGSFCEHETAYGITLKVKRLNISLEDIYEL